MSAALETLGWFSCPHGRMHATLMDIPFVRSLEKAGYETKIRELNGWLREGDMVLTDPSLSP